MSWQERVARRPLAEKDIQDQVEYYIFVKGVPEVAEAFVNAVEHALDLIVENPELRPVIEVASPKLQGLRCRTVPGFDEHLIYYKTEGDHIELFRVLHSKRDRENILAEGS